MRRIACVALLLPCLHAVPAQAEVKLLVADTIRTGDPVKVDAAVRGRGVEWVRPTDLIARHSAHAAGRGLDFQAELARRTRTPIGAGVRRLGDRARRLPPISAFGHSHAPQAQQVSRSGVSMS